MRSRRDKTYCEWCGHEIAYDGADVPYHDVDDNDVPHILCAACFHRDSEGLRETIEALQVAEIEFYGDYREDDF